MDTGRIVKIGVIVVGFLSAGIITVMTLSGDEGSVEAPENEEMVDLVCVDSGEHIEQPFSEIVAYGGRIESGSRRPSRGEDQNKPSVTVYPVAACGPGGAVLASYCEECKKFYPRQLPDGTDGVCPVCGGH